MPKVTRTSGRLTRQSRAVFGDVSNNDKGESSTTAAAKKSTAARVTDARPVHRRSSRLSRGGDDGETTTDHEALDFSIGNDAQKTTAAVAPARRSNKSSTTTTTSRNSEKIGEKKQAPLAARAEREGPKQQISDEKEPARKTRASARVTVTKRPKEPLQDIEEVPAPAKAARSRGRFSSQTSGSDLPVQISGPSRPSTKRAARSSAQEATSGNGSSPKPVTGKRTRPLEPPIFSPRKTARMGKTKTIAKAIAASKPCKPFVPKKTGPGPDFFRDDDFRLFRGAPGDKPFDAAKYTLAIAPADLANRRKLEEASEYVTDIMQRLFDREELTRPHPYLNKQPKLNKNMRSILVDWLVEVHMKFRLVPETLYLCVNIIDRFLDQAFVERTKLQLVGITALLIACKYEEIYPPEVRDCCYICDHAYTRQEVLDMEAEMLKVLEYRMSVPTAYPFMLRFLHLAKATVTERNAAFYYVERMLQEYSFLRHRPSLVACACISLAMNNPDIRMDDCSGGKAPGVPKELLEYTGFELEKVLEVARLVCSRVSNTQVTNSKRELGAVKRKYESAKLDSVSLEYAEPEIKHIEMAYY